MKVYSVTYQSYFGKVRFYEYEVEERQKTYRVKNGGYVSVINKNKIDKIINNTIYFLENDNDKYKKILLEYVENNILERIERLNKELQKIEELK